MADPARLSVEIDRIIRSGVLTNGPTVRRLEDTAASYLGVRHVVAVSSCTSGLMLVLRCAELTGDVVLPSFTFAATAHAVSWNGLRPVFADVDPATLTLNPESVDSSLGARTTASTREHTSTARRADVEGCRALADAERDPTPLRRRPRLRVRGGGRPRGRLRGRRGVQPVANQVVVAGEGGLILHERRLVGRAAQDREGLRKPGRLRLSVRRLNARLSELDAAVVLASLSDLDERLAERAAIAGRYRDAVLPHGARIRVRPSVKATGALQATYDPSWNPRFGIGADGLAASLAARGIETRRYYSPPVHRMRAYAYLNGQVADLPYTDRAADRALTPPLWAGMGERVVGRVAAAIQGTRR